MTLNEIVEALEAEDELEGDIILFPPGDGNFTDEDSGDENEANFLHLPSRMLRSEVEIQTRPTDTNNEEEDIEEDHLENEEPARKKKKKKEFAVTNGQIMHHFLHHVVKETVKKMFMISLMRNCVPPIVLSYWSVKT